MPEDAVDIFWTTHDVPLLTVNAERVEWLQKRGFITLRLPPHEPPFVWALTPAGAKAVFGTFCPTPGSWEPHTYTENIVR
jgi:hypothetical protein